AQAQARFFGDLQRVDSLAEGMGGDDVGIMPLGGFDVVIDAPNAAVVKEFRGLWRECSEGRAGAGFPFGGDLHHDRLEPLFQLTAGWSPAGVDDAKAVGADVGGVPGAL